MEYRRMGRTGLKVSELCLGTMTFGHSADEEESRKMVDLAIDSGINFFDTANSYADSRSEQYLGNILKGRRRDQVIATKFFNPKSHHNLYAERILLHPGGIACVLYIFFFNHLHSGFVPFCVCSSVNLYSAFPTH